MKKNTDEKQICFSSLSFYEKKYWRKTNLFLVTILLWKKNTDEKQICF